MEPTYALSGLAIGFLVGLTGMGGGALMTPLLILVLGVKPTVAVGSDLACAAITKIAGAWQHQRQGTVHRPLAWRMAMGSVPGALLGAAAVHRLQMQHGESAQALVLRCLGLVLILVALALFARTLSLSSRWIARRDHGQTLRHPVWIAGCGLVLGFLVGMTSVGSGTLFGVLLLVAFGLSAREMVGTDVYHAALLVSAAAVAHLWVGNVDFVLVANLLLGSVPGVLLGSRLMVWLPEAALRPVLAGVLLLSGLRMI